MILSTKSKTAAILLGLFIGIFADESVQSRQWLRPRTTTTRRTTAVPTTSSTQPPPAASRFGKQMQSHFIMEPNTVQLNHGSFGQNPRVVLQNLKDYYLRSEKTPDLWGRRQVPQELVKVRKTIGDFISADGEDLVMIPNVSSGYTSVLRSMVFTPGDRILHFNTIYVSDEGALKFILNAHKGHVTTIVFNVNYPEKDDEILQRLEKFLDGNYDPSRPIRLALIDHISSLPTVRNPVEQMIPMFRSRNIQVLVDGAHAPGNIPINITALDPDYYVADLHKWLYVPRNAGVMYIKKKHQAILHPAIISRYWRNPSDLQKEFWWIGTYDNAKYLTVHKALEFRQKVGGEKAIMEYIHNLAYEGGNLVAKRLGTRVLQQGSQMTAMVDVQLPIRNPNDPILTDDWWIDEQLYKYNDTFAPVYKHNGFWWARLSAQIYLDIDDFEKGALHFAIMCNEINARQMTASG